MVLQQAAESKGMSKNSTVSLPACASWPKEPAFLTLGTRDRFLARFARVGLECFEHGAQAELTTDA
jgi:hypothetical protein